MHRRTLVGAVGTVALAGCLLAGDEWETTEAWLEDTLSLVDEVGDALEEWADDPTGVPPSAFDDLAGRTTDHLDRFDDEIVPIKDDLIDEAVGPDDLDRSGESIWQTIEEIEFILQEAKTGTEAVADAEGDPDALTATEREATETVIDEYEAVLEDGEDVID